MSKIIRNVVKSNIGSIGSVGSIGSILFFKSLYKLNI